MNYCTECGTQFVAVSNTRFPGLCVHCVLKAMGYTPGDVITPCDDCPPLTVAVSEDCMLQGYND